MQLPTHPTIHDAQHVLLDIILIKAQVIVLPVQISIQVVQLVTALDIVQLVEEV